MDRRSQKRWHRRLLMAVSTLCLTVSSTGRADDVDIYLPAYQAQGGGGQPQVMLIIDTSASMKETAGTSRQTRLQVTKDIVSGLVSKHPGINFSLTVFNDNRAEIQCNWFGINCQVQELYNGGRVVQSFTNTPRQSGSERLSLLNTINALQANTPFMPWPRYTVIFRVSQLYMDSGGVAPSRDRNAEDNNGNYRRPLRACDLCHLHD